MYFRLRTNVMHILGTGAEIVGIWCHCGLGKGLSGKGRRGRIEGKWELKIDDEEGGGDKWVKGLRRTATDACSEALWWQHDVPWRGRWPPLMPGPCGDVFWLITHKITSRRRCCSSDCVTHLETHMGNLIHTFRLILFIFAQNIIIIHSSFVAQ